MKTRSNLINSVAALVAMAGLAGVAGAQTIAIVAAPLDPAPGISGAFFTTSILDNPVIDSTGAVAFRSGLVVNGTTVTTVNSRGIWYGTPGNLTLALRSGDQAPGLTSGVFLNTATSGVGLGAPVRLNGTGQMLLGSILTGTGIVATPAASENDSALFVGSKGSIVKGLQRLDSAPGTGGFNFNIALGSVSLQQCIMNNSGAIALRSTFNDTSTLTNDGLWVGAPSALALIERKGSVAPSMGGAKWPAASTGFSQIINSAGQVLFDMKFAADATTTPPVTTFNDSTLWAYTPGRAGGTTLIIREGDPAPGTSGATFNFGGSGGAAWSVGFGAADYNNSGETLLWEEVFGGDVAGATNNFGLYMWSGNALTLKLRRGGAAPGTDGLINTFNTSGLCINNNHQMFAYGTITDAGLGTVTTANDLVMYSGDPAAPTLVYREGDPAPGTGDAFLGGSVSGSPVFNDNGYAVVTVSGLTGPNVVLGTNDAATYALKAGQAPILLLRSGQSIEVQPGVFKTISSGMAFNQFSNGDGLGQSINNQNKVTGRLFFTDSSNAAVVIQINDPVVCYANCDHSDVPPILNANDFQCFLNAFASGSSYANCDNSSVDPILNANDFQCFLNTFAAGCP